MPRVEQVDLSVGYHPGMISGVMPLRFHRDWIFSVVMFIMLIVVIFVP